MGEADRVVLSYTGGAAVEKLRSRSYVRYLRQSKAGPVTVGDEWNEVVSAGCGRTREITLLIRAIDGPQQIGPETEFAFQHSDAE